MAHSHDPLAEAIAAGRLPAQPDPGFLAWAATLVVGVEREIEAERRALASAQRRGRRARAKARRPTASPSE